ncbi:hypothetical protein GCM10022406_28710 [Hymenobacter algoricola]|uniref:Uncharacterized protein n=1 Tax=Hymenobacter algoricola TaxID=486267 RepID=A0ABP7NEX5_9BACT
MVYWFNQDLFWVEKQNDLPTQRKALKNWFEAVGLRINDPERQRVQEKVKSLMKGNQKQVDSDVF